MSRLRTVLPLLVLLAPAPAAAAQEVPAGEAAPAEAVPWSQRLTEDAELGFTPRSAELARADLAQPVLSDQLRATALMGLGCAKARVDRPRLESFAVEGELPVRTAAVLALGELGSAETTVLESLLADPEPLIVECAMLALLRSGGAGSRDRIEALAADAGNLQAHAASSLLVFQIDRGASEATPATSRLLDLRLAAARRYGLVRGQSWQVLLLSQLTEDEAFLDRIVYLAAAELRDPGVRDHFLEILLAGPEPGADDNLDSLRGAVNAIPAELSTMIEAGVWTPRDGRAWSTLLAEIDRQRLEGLTGAVLRNAWLQVPGLRTQASLLMTRGGSDEGLPTLEMGLETQQVPAQVRIIEALGGTGIHLYVKSFAPLRDHPSLTLAAAALIGQVRLGYDEAETRLRRAFSDLPTKADVAAERGEYDELPDGDVFVLDAFAERLVTGMCNTVRDPAIRELLLEIFPRLGGEERMTVATALAGIGRPETRTILREALRGTPPRGEVGARRIRALAQSLSLEDLKLLHELFPVENDFEVNATLALALTKARDTKVLPLLRAALWDEPLYRSLLAGALIVDVAGVDALREELQHPSLDATTRDLRRVGFALGEFGGLEQVEILGERLGSVDPALQGALLGALAARTY